MSTLRALLRLAGIAILTILMLLPGGVVMLLDAVFGRSPARSRARTELFHRWARGIVAILGVRVEERGVPAEPPFLMVSNHLSYIDIFVIASQVRCVFVARGDMRPWPVLGWLTSIVDTVFIDRASRRDIPRVTEAIERILESGRGVVMFPEGTTTDGGSVGRFSSSLLVTASRTGRAVSWAALTYHTPDDDRPVRETVCWFIDEPFSRHALRLLGLRRIEATLTFGTEGVVESDRKRLAARLREEVSGHFRPVSP